MFIARRASVDLAGDEGALDAVAMADVRFICGWRRCCGVPRLVEVSRLLGLFWRRVQIEGRNGVRSRLLSSAPFDRVQVLVSAVLRMRCCVGDCDFVVTCGSGRSTIRHRDTCG